MTNTAPKKIMLSAVQPTNKITIGNYIGAISQWVRLQNDYECLFFAVDLHTITARQDPQELRAQTYQTLATYIAAGIDPEAALLFCQSHVPEHAELAWVLNCYTYMGELNRMTQYKDKSAKSGANIPVGLFDYPVLMASDILLYQTNLVPVGDDQKQHVELTRDLAIRMNNLYGGDLFTVPEIYTPPVGGRVMSLQDPLAKMSKSDPDANSAVYMGDTNDQILKKLKKAVSDSGSEITDDETKPGVRNLLSIQAALTGKTRAQVAEAYAGKQYGHLKTSTAELVIEKVAPIRDRAEALQKDLGYLDSVLARGAIKAREKAARTLTETYKRLGFIPKPTALPKP